MITKRLLRFLLGPSFATTENTETESLALNHNLLNAKHKILNSYGRSSLEAEKIVPPPSLSADLDSLLDPAESNDYVDKWIRAWELSIIPEGFVRGIEMMGMWPLEVSWARYHTIGRSGGQTYWQLLQGIIYSGNPFPGFVASLAQSMVEEAISDQPDAGSYTWNNGTMVKSEHKINIISVLKGNHTMAEIIPFALKHATACIMSFPFFYYSSMQILGVYNHVDTPTNSPWGPSLAWLLNFYNFSTPALPNVGVMALWHVSNYFLGLVGRTHLAEINKSHAQMGPEVAHHMPPFSILYENFLRSSFIMRCMTSNLFGFFFFRFAVGKSLGDDLRIDFPDLCGAIALDTVVRCGINHLYILSTWMIERYVYGTGTVEEEEDEEEV